MSIYRLWVGLRLYISCSSEFFFQSIDFLHEPIDKWRTAPSAICETICIYAICSSSVEPTLEYFCRRKIIFDTCPVYSESRRLATECLIDTLELSSFYYKLSFYSSYIFWRSTHSIRLFQRLDESIFCLLCCSNTSYTFFSLLAYIF